MYFVEEKLYIETRVQQIKLSNIYLIGIFVLETYETMPLLADLTSPRVFSNQMVRRLWPARTIYQTLLQKYSITQYSNKI